MAIVPTAVALLGYPAGLQINLRDREWYQNYFFNRASGQAAFWGKQSDNDVIIDGQVFDWAFVNDPSPNLTNRTSVAQFGVTALQSDRGVNFTGFEVIVVVVGVSKYYPRYPEPGGTDGGSTWVQSTFRKHRAVVMRVGDRFDFVAHELGHALGLQHSFGSPLFQTPGDQAGGYGHPYCIMSAMAYGGFGGPFNANVTAGRMA